MTTTFEGRQKQYEENDVPAAWRSYVAGGIRKKFADKFDFGAMTDQEIIQKHYSRFGQGMNPAAYQAKLEEVYGTGFTPPAAPKETLGEKVQGLGEAGKEIAKGLVPFAVPEVGKAVALKAGAKAVATKIPGVSQVGFLAGHAVNVGVDTAAARDLEQKIAGLPVPDEETRTQEYFSRLRDSLAAKGYSDEQIMQEASARARNVTRGYQKTVESIDKDVEAIQSQAVTEPARAAADAFFLGVGAPAIEGALQAGLAKVGLVKAAAVAAKPAANMLGTVASHIKTGVVVGAPGMGIQGAISAGVLAASENKTPQEIGQALVKGGVEGLKHGAVGGAIIGGLAGAAEIGIGAAAKPFVQRVRQREYRESQAQVELDNARLRGWQEYTAGQRALVAKNEVARRASILRDADDFNPHTTTFPMEGDPAEIATSIIQQNHGDEAALSEVGMRAASKIEERVRLYQDANADLEAFSRRELPPGEGVPGAVEKPTPVGPIEQGGRPLPANAPAGAPVAEPNPLREPAFPAPQEAPGPGQEAAVPAPAPEKTPAPKVEFNRAGPETFRKSVRKALEARPEAAGSLAVHPPSYYTKPGVEMYMTADGKTGYALVPRPNGGKELVSAFNTGEQGLGLAGVREAVLRGATHLDAIKPLEKLYEKAGFVTTRTEKNYTPGQPDVVYMEQPGAPQAPVKPAPAPTPAPRSVEVKGIGKHADLTVGEGGAIHIARLGLPEGEQAAPGAIGKALDAIVQHADEQQKPVTIQITQTPGPRGGMIPVEKLLPWYEQRGFKVTGSTNLPEGQIGTASLRREPKPPVAGKISMLDAQRSLMGKALANPETPSAKELAAPAVTPSPGRWHQADLWADANITAAGERIKQREAEFPEADRKRAREAGFIGEKPGHRDPTSYDWADFADRVQIGVNVILKHGLNKAVWVEKMVAELGGKFREVADRVYQEAVAAFHARRPTGVDEARRVVDDYVHQAGLGLGATRHDVYPELDPKFSGRVAVAYELMDTAKPGTREYQEAKASYDALNHEVEAQYQAILKAGYKIEHTTEDPYATSADMRADVAQNKRIKSFKAVEGGHPFVTPEQSDKFRAVHDFFGHAAEGYEFGPRGEDAAFRKHASTLSNAAIPALATETRGQNSWVNFWPKNAKLAPRERPFAEQKFALLPRWVYEDVLKARSERAPANRLGAGFPTRKGGRGAFEQAALTLARGVRPVKSPAAVRARFVADGTDAVSEMMAVSPQSATWYHDDIKRMHDMVAQRLPEAGTPGGQALFDLLLGFTSPQKPVVDNFAIAFRLMHDYTKSGKVPLLQRFGQEINPSARAWVPRLNVLIERFGGDLNAMRDYLLTKNEKGIYNVEKEFGPKVGPFTLNIQGIHDQITVDAWMVRRLRRLSGRMFKTVDGKRVYDDEVTLSAQEQRDIEASIHELSRKTGLDADAVQAVLWDNEKMIWERAGHAAPRIPFSVAAEGVFANMDKNAGEINQAMNPKQMKLFGPDLTAYLKKGKTIQ